MYDVECLSDNATTQIGPASFAYINSRGTLEPPSIDRDDARIPPPIIGYGDKVSGWVLCIWLIASPGKVLFREKISKVSFFLIRALREVTLFLCVYISSLLIQSSLML